MPVARLQNDYAAIGIEPASVYPPFPMLTERGPQVVSALDRPLTI